MMELQQSLLSLPGHIFFEIKDLLEKVNPGKVSHIGAPYEADHQLVALFHQGIIDYVYSVDSDLSVLVCDTVDNVCYSKKKKTYLLVHFVPSISREHFTDVFSSRKNISKELTLVNKESFKSLSCFHVAIATVQMD